MKSGGWWNLRGRRPDAREAARDAAPRRGASVGAWLNNAIQTDADDDDPMEYAKFDRDTDYDEPPYRNRENVDDDRRDDSDGRRDRLERDHRARDRGQDGERHRDHARDRNGEPHHGRERDRNRERDREHNRNRKQHQSRERDRERNRAREQERLGEQERERERNRERERQRGQERDQSRDREQGLGSKREASRNRGELDDLHNRLNQLTSQLERLTHTESVQREMLSRGRHAPGELGDATSPSLTGAPVPPHWVDRPSDRNGPPASGGELSIDQAVAEIAARQRALESETAVAAPAGPHRLPPSPLDEIAARQRELDDAAPVTGPIGKISPVGTMDVGGIERHLRDLTARIEELRPSSELAKSITAVRADLAEIGRQLNEALPHRAIEPLELEIKALAQRIDHSRQCGVDANVLAGLEHGLVELREALRGLTTSEKLVGFDEAVNGLAQKLDLIAAKDDPAALQQLETAIGGLRGIVSHVASNDTLTKVAEDVRALAAKVDVLGNSGVTEHALSALDRRIETLTNALSASAEAGHAVPRELEKLLSGLIEKLEWVQLTHTDHAALAHLEDRIATLVKRFDASDARFVHLEAVERGLADLLVHLDQMRGANGTTPALHAPLAVDAIERDVAEIKQSERRTQDSLEAVQGTVEHVVDRLAMIESDIRSDSPSDATPRSAPVAQSTPVPLAAIALEPVAEPVPMTVAADVPTAAPPSNRAGARRPIDPSLPPDHPIEPGAVANRSGPSSAADRIAASEAAIDSSKPPVIPDPGGKSNFIAAARRAAQVAAATPAESQPNEPDKKRLSLPKNLAQRVRALLVAGSAVIIVLFGLHMASRLFVDGGSAPIADVPSEKTAPPAATPNEANPPMSLTPQPSPVPEQGTAPGTVPSAAPSSKSGALPASQPGSHDDADQAGTGSAAPPTDNKSSAVALPLWVTPDVTGSLPPRSTTAPAPPTASAENLPAAIGGPVLRAAAMAGDASAAYEVAMRFSEGRGIPQDDDEAAHWFERAAKQGLALAQFRLGTFYEKGTAVKKDLAAARDLYLAAANQGNGKAMHNVAVLYAEGINGPADYRSAAHWFAKAADHGIADSQYNLGILYARGIGVEQNFAESYKWFALAASQGDGEAATKRDEVLAKLDQQSLTAARVAVQTWAAQPQPEDAISVKTPPGGWDMPAKAAQPAKTKPHPTSAKAAAPDTKTN